VTVLYHVLWMMHYLLVGIYDKTLYYCLITCQAFGIGTSTKNRHVRQVKIGSLPWAVSLDLVWAVGLDEMYAPFVLDHWAASLTRSKHRLETSRDEIGTKLSALHPKLPPVDTQKFVTKYSSSDMYTLCVRLLTKHRLCRNKGPKSRMLTSYTSQFFDTFITIEVNMGTHTSYMSPFLACL